MAMEWRETYYRGKSEMAINAANGFAHISPDGQLRKGEMRSGVKKSFAVHENRPLMIMHTCRCLNVDTKRINNFQ
jgi:hypothetical protein